MKFLAQVVPFLALLLACEIPLPGGEVPNCVNAQVVDGSVVLSPCPSGGSGGSGGVPASGSGAGGAAGASGSAGAAGHVHPDAGAPDGGQHQGLPVSLPLPVYAQGSQTFDVRPTSEQPQRDAGGIGAARTRCRVSHVNFDDAIVYPGQPGRAHAHQYAGADKVDAFGIQPGAGGTCRGGTANLSAYWWPALLSPEGVVQTPVYVDVYYKQSHYDLSPQPTNVVPPPKGLRIVAGDAAARAAQNTNRFFWSCGDNNGAKSATVPSCGSQAVVLNVHFPQCYAGQQAADGRSHMSYPSGGRCPASHPIVLPSVSYHIYFRNVPAGARLSCDAATGPGGYCIHADLIVNWDETIMAGMVAGCVNRGLSGGSHLTCEGREYFGRNGTP